MNREEAKSLRLLCIFAHPDDESLGVGGVFAKYGAEGADTYLLTATRGELGWFGPPAENPGPIALGKIREGELKEAARVLGIRDVKILDYRDGQLDKADQSLLTQQLGAHIRRVRPHVVLTFDQQGLYGHPDHIAVTRAATAAAVSAASADFADPLGLSPHVVSKLYYFVLTDELRQAYEQAFGELVMNIDGVDRRVVPWPHWSISTWIDTSAHWKTVWEAIKCHRSQLPGYQKLLDLSDDYHRVLWGQVMLHRVYSLVPTTDKEDDIFTGLRGSEEP